MSLINMKELLTDAYEKKYAIPAFNFDNFEILMGILDGAELVNTPIILQITEPALSWLGIKNVVDVVKNECRKRNLTIALHLDHADNFDLIKKCIHEGFTSVMIDSSNKEYEENLRVTKQVVEYAHKYNVSVEAELGYVSNISLNDDELTNVDLVKNFSEHTGLDILGVSIGNTHGGITRNRNIDLELLKEINNIVKKPLALHGSSGIKLDMIQESIKYGITKINTETALRLVFKDCLNKALQNKNEIKPRNIMQFVREGIKEQVIVLYSITNSINKERKIQSLKNDIGNIFFDKLDPISKLNYIVKKSNNANIIKINNEEIDLRILILMILYCIDETLKYNEEKKYSYYIYGDKSIYNFIKLITNQEIELTDFYQSMIDIDNAKLIYRFTLAKKFLESDSEIKQLRINSWGIEYLLQNNYIFSNNNLYEYLTDYCKKEYCKNTTIYKELKQLLLSNLSIQNVSKIKELNAPLVIKLAS